MYSHIQLSLFHFLCEFWYNFKFHISFLEQLDDAEKDIEELNSDEGVFSEEG